MVPAFCGGNLRQQGEEMAERRGRARVNKNQFEGSHDLVLCICFVSISYPRTHLNLHAKTTDCMNCLNYLKTAPEPEQNPHISVLFHEL